MMQKLLPFVSLIVLFVALAIASPHFLTQTNLSSVVRQTAVINIMSLGMTVIIIAGGIDLSAGSLIALVTVAVALLLPHQWTNPETGLQQTIRGLSGLLARTSFNKSVTKPRCPRLPSSVARRISIFSRSKSSRPAK